MDPQPAEPPQQRQRGSSNVPCLGAGYMQAKPPPKKLLPSRPQQTYSQRYRNTRLNNPQALVPTGSDSASVSGSYTAALKKPWNQSSKIPKLSNEALPKPSANASAAPVPVLFNVPKPKTSIPKPIPQKPKGKATAAESPKPFPAPPVAGLQKRGLGLGYAPRQQVAAQLTAGKKPATTAKGDNASSASKKTKPASTSESTAEEALQVTTESKIVSASKIPKFQSSTGSLTVPATAAQKVQDARIGKIKLTSKPSRIPVFKASTKVLKVPKAKIAAEEEMTTAPAPQPEDSSVTADINLNTTEPEPSRAKPVAITLPDGIDYSSLDTSDPVIAEAVVADIDAKMAELDARIAQAEAEERLERFQKAADAMAAVSPSPVLLENDMFEDAVTDTSMLPSPVPIEEVLEVSKMREEALGALYQEMVQSEVDPLTETPSAHVDILFPACRISRIEQSTSNIVVSPSSSSTNVSTFIRVDERNREVAAAKLPPRDKNNNIIGSEVTHEIDDNPNSNATTCPTHRDVFHSCLSMQPNTKDKVKYTNLEGEKLENSSSSPTGKDYHDGSMECDEMTALWNSCIQELREELKESGMDSLHRIRFPKIQPEPKPKKPKHEKKRKSYAKMKKDDSAKRPSSVERVKIARRISSNLKPVTPEVYPVDWDLSQREMRMLFRARLPKTFNLIDLPRSSINTNYIPFKMYSNPSARYFAPGRPDLLDKCPVEVSSILRMFPTWTEAGLRGNITVKNISDHLLTFRLRSSVDGRYRVTPPMGCIASQKTGNILVETNEGTGENVMAKLSKDKLLLELIPLTNYFSNIYSLYLFWEKIDMANQQEIIRTFLSPMEVDKLRLERQNRERNKKQKLIAFGLFLLAAFLIGCGLMVHKYWVKPPPPPRGSWYYFYLY